MRYLLSVLAVPILMSACARDSASVTIIGPHQLAGATVLRAGREVGRFDQPSAPGGDVVAMFALPRGTESVEIWQDGFQPIVLAVPQEESSETYLTVDAGELRSSPSAGEAPPNSSLQPTPQAPTNGSIRETRSGRLRSG